MGDPEVGRRIRLARKEAGLTQAALASRVGLAHPQSVSNYERGVDEADADRLRRIAEATKKPLSFFLDEPASSNGPHGMLEGPDDQASARHQEVVDRLAAIEEQLRLIAVATGAERP